MNRNVISDMQGGLICDPQMACDPQVDNHYLKGTRFFQNSLEHLSSFMLYFLSHCSRCSIPCFLMCVEQGNLRPWSLLFCLATTLTCTSHFLITFDLDSLMSSIKIVDPIPCHKHWPVLFGFFICLLFMICIFYLLFLVPRTVTSMLYKFKSVCWISVEEANCCEIISEKKKNHWPVLHWGIPIGSFFEVILKWQCTGVV